MSGRQVFNQTVSFYQQYKQFISAIKCNTDTLIPHSISEYTLTHTDICLLFHNKSSSVAHISFSFKGFNRVRSYPTTWNLYGSEIIQTNRDPNSSLYPVFSSLKRYCRAQWQKERQEMTINGAQEQLGNNLCWGFSGNIE